MQQAGKPLFASILINLKHITSADPGHTGISSPAKRITTKMVDLDT
jgi:hypothetical protein